MTFQESRHGPDVIMYEENAGSATNRMAFPGLQSCIAVFATYARGIAGTHITFGNTNDDIDKMLAVMKRRIGQDICKEVYVVGLISTEFKPSTKSSLNTRAKIRDKIKSKLGHHPSVYFYDTLIERHIHLVLLKDLTNPLARATILCTSMNSGILGTPQDITNLLASADMKEIKYTQFVKR